MRRSKRCCGEHFCGVNGGARSGGCHPRAHQYRGRRDAISHADGAVDHLRRESYDDEKHQVIRHGSTPGLPAAEYLQRPTHSECPAATSASGALISEVHAQRSRAYLRGSSPRRRIRFLCRLDHRDQPARASIAEPCPRAAARAGDCQVASSVPPLAVDPSDFRPHNPGVLTYGPFVHGREPVTGSDGRHR